MKNLSAQLNIYLHLIINYYQVIICEITKINIQLNLIER